MGWVHQWQHSPVILLTYELPSMLRICCRTERSHGRFALVFPHGLATGDALTGDVAGSADGSITQPRMKRERCDDDDDDDDGHTNANSKLRGFANEMQDH